MTKGGTFMANSIALFKQYIDLLDEVYRLGAKTSVLDMSGTLVQAAANANQVIIPKTALTVLRITRETAVM